MKKSLIKLLDEGLVDVVKSDKQKERPKTAGTVNGPQKVIKQENDTSSAAQRQRILEWLRKHGSITTIEAREKIDCLHPCGRVMELRKLGHEIETIWTIEPTPCGTLHRVANYVLNVKKAS